MLHSCYSSNHTFQKFVLTINVPFYLEFTEENFLPTTKHVESLAERGDHDGCSVGQEIDLL